MLKEQIKTIQRKLKDVCVELHNMPLEGDKEWQIRFDSLVSSKWSLADDLKEAKLDFVKSNPKEAWTFIKQIFPLGKNKTTHTNNFETIELILKDDNLELYPEYQLYVKYSKAYINAY